MVAGCRWASPPDARPLASVPPGTAGRLDLGSLPRTSGLRLAQLGLRGGAAVTVLPRTAGGGRRSGPVLVSLSVRRPVA